MFYDGASSNQLVEKPNPGLVENCENISAQLIVANLNNPGPPNPGFQRSTVYPNAGNSTVVITTPIVWSQETSRRFDPRFPLDTLQYSGPGLVINQNSQTWNINDVPELSHGVTRGERFV